MLHKSNNNIKKKAFEFVDDNDFVTLLSAYIKLPVLKEMNRSNNIKIIVVRWEIMDLCLGVSDIELFRYCSDNNIVLYRNTRIHLKAFWNNHDEVLFGSANITGRGIGEKGNYNYE